MFGDFWGNWEFSDMNSTELAEYGEGRTDFVP